VRALSLYRLPTSTRARRRAITVTCLAFAGGVAAVSVSVAASRIAALAGSPAGLGRPLTVPPPGAVRVICVATAASGASLTLLLRRWRYVPIAVLSLAAAALLATFRFYPFTAYFLARRAFAHSELRPILASGDRWGAATALLFLIALAPFLRGLIAALVRTGDLHGSARLARPEDILKAGFIFDDPAKLLSQSSALPIGNVEVHGGLRLVRALGDVHVLLFAPPGSGKTTAFVIPTAMDWSGAAVILDVKGEIAQATAGHRQRQGARILLLDPSRNEPFLARFNPLLSVRPHPFDVQDVSLLAQLLVPDSLGNRDPFWPQSARTLLEGVLLHVLYAEPEKTLASCYRFLCSPEVPIHQQFERMLATEHDPAAPHGWKHHPRVQTAARTFLDMPPQTRGGVVANALASLSPYADPILDAATAVSDFALEDLYTPQERPVSLYLVIDPNSLQRLADHIRIVLSQIAAALTRELPAAGSRHPVLLLLDEFAVFGRMKAIETAIAYFRGYGVQCYIVVQHVGQLNAAYGQNESISPNCSVHIAFAPADLQTATQLSKRAGSQTVRYERGSVSSQSPLQSHVSVQETDSGRPLLMPDEIMRLPKGKALVLRTGAYPLIVEPRPFFADPLRQAAAGHPLPASERSVPDFRHWLDRKPVPPVKVKTSRRGEIARLLHSEPLLP
jgi:type IV secretion system protein VirD4